MRWILISSIHPGNTFLFLEVTIYIYISYNHIYNMYTPEITGEIAQWNAMQSNVILIYCHRLQILCILMQCVAMYCNLLYLNVMQYYLIRPIWRFPKMGVSPHHPFQKRIQKKRFLQLLNSTPMTMETPICLGVSCWWLLGHPGCGRSWRRTLRIHLAAPRSLTAKICRGS